MNESYKVLKKAVDRTGAKALASKLKLSQALIYKWCQEPNNEESCDKSGAHNPLDRLKKIYEETGDIEIVRWLCQVANGYYVANPSEDRLKLDARVMRNVHRIIKEFSETLDAISQSYIDKKITKKEADEIRKEWEDLKSIGEGFVKACEEGAFNK